MLLDAVALTAQYSVTVHQLFTSLIAEAHTLIPPGPQSSRDIVDQFNFLTINTPPHLKLPLAHLATTGVSYNHHVRLPKDVFLTTLHPHSASPTNI